MANGPAEGELVTPGLCEFMGVEIEVEPGLFVPRKETELLGRTAVNLLPRDGQPCRIVDICCGAGNLACVLAVAREHARVWAADLCARTVDLARRNVTRLGLASRVQVAQGDLFEPLAGLDGSVDLVICNPPYISTSRLDQDSAHLLAHEPRTAFDGGPYGLTVHGRLVREAVPYLRPGGWLAFEFGLGQWRQAQLLLKRCRAYGTVDFVTDEAGQPRVAIARKADVPDV